MGLIGAPVVIGGPLADRIGAAVPIAIADEVASLVVLGDGPPLADDASVVATGLPDASMRSALMLAAWDDTHEIAAVVAEAKRVVQTGGSVCLGRRNVDAMVQSTPTTMRSARLYARYPDRIRAIIASQSVALTELGLVRAGLGSIESWDYELPVDAFEDAVSYRRAVESGMWLGIDRIGESERSTLLSDLDTDLRHADFPLVEYQPWTLAWGVKQ